MFIVGCPRSGTTLLSVILDRHSELTITPETAFYDEIAPKLLSNHDFDVTHVLSDWTRLPELGLDAHRVVRHCGRTPSAARLFGGLLELYAQDRSKACVGEKTPQHLRHVPQIVEDFPEARIICVVRDGRDVALSLASMPWWPSSLNAGVDAWLEAVSLSDAFEAQYPAGFLTVRYEDLVASPEATLVSVMEFVGLEFEARQLIAGASGVVLSRSLQWKGLALDMIDQARLGHRRRTAGAAVIDYLNHALEPTLSRLGYR